MDIVTDTVTTQPTLRISNVNVQIVSGSGTSRGTPNGRGNLILGYNEKTRVDSSKRSKLDARSGSHFLILGMSNGYSGFGGLVGGIENAVSDGKFASVLGGTSNLSLGNGSAVLGGVSMVSENGSEPKVGQW
jgi:hypothetical protein